MEGLASQFSHWDVFPKESVASSCCIHLTFNRHGSVDKEMRSAINYKIELGWDRKCLENCDDNWMKMTKSWKLKFLLRYHFLIQNHNLVQRLQKAFLKVMAKNCSILMIWWYKLNVGTWPIFRKRKLGKGLGKLGKGVITEFFPSKTAKLFSVVSVPLNLTTLYQYLMR